MTKAAICYTTWDMERMNRFGRTHNRTSNTNSNCDLHLVFHGHPNRCYVLSSIGLQGHKRCITNPRGFNLLLSARGSNQWTSWGCGIAQQFLQWKPPLRWVRRGVWLLVLNAYGSQCRKTLQLLRPGVWTTISMWVHDKRVLTPKQQREGSSSLVLARLAERNFLAFQPHRKFHGHLLGEAEKDRRGKHGSWAEKR